MVSGLKKSAVFWMIVSVMGFSFMQLFVKLSGEDISVYLQVLCRNALGMIIAGYYVRKEGLPVFGPAAEQPYLFARSIAGFLGLVTFFCATRLGDIAEATIINRTGPFFTTLFSVIFLKEKTRLPQWIALMLVFCGGLIAGNPGLSSSMAPMLLALASAVCNGIAYTLLAHFRDKVPAMTVVMHFSVVCVICALPFVIRAFTMPGARDILMLAMIALTGCLGLISITIAYRLAPASEISIYDQLGIVMSVLIGWICLGETPSVSTIAGGLIVLTVSSWIFFYNKNKNTNHKE